MPPRRMAERKDPFWSSKIFLSVLALKIISSFLLASSYMTQFFTPFLNRFVLSRFQNPWEFFYSLHSTRMFPYPTAMLWIMALPRVLFAPVLPASWESVTAMHLFVMRIPLLAFDILLLYQLLKFFPTRQKKILTIYWCSPIVFFINYVHGQLDIIPTALFFVSAFFLIREKYFFSALLYALAAASKTSVFIALPFVLVFFYKKKTSLSQGAVYLFTFFAAYFLLLSPYLGSPAFRQMVFNSPEQKKLFEFVFPISPSLNLVVCPTVVGLLFIKFASYKKLNSEIFLMFLGIVFAALVVFVPAMPGWFMWSLPFLIYFYVNNKDYSRAPFVLYNAVYILYFLFFFEKGPDFLPSHTDLTLVRNLAASILMASVGFIAVWMYNLGVRRNEELRVAQAPFLVGIGGDSGSGKHTLLKILRMLVGKDRSIAILGDDFHKWERKNENWSVYTPLNPTANRLHQGIDSAVALKDGRSIEMVHYDHATGKFTNPRALEPNKFIFFVGLHPFYLKKMRDLIPLKIFMDPEESLRRHWKVSRDVAQRGHEHSQVMEQISSRHADKLKYIEPQKTFADLVIRYAPVDPLPKEETSGKKVPLKTLYEMDNSINLENLIALLSKIPTLAVASSTTISSQELEVSGSIDPRSVMEVAYQLGINFDELHINAGGWLRDHNGITQLVFLVLYHQKMKA